MQIAGWSMRRLSIWRVLYGLGAVSLERWSVFARLLIFSRENFNKESSMIVP